MTTQCNLQKNRQLKSSQNNHHAKLHRLQIYLTKWTTEQLLKKMFSVSVFFWNTQGRLLRWFSNKNHQTRYGQLVMLILIATELFRTNSFDRHIWYSPIKSVYIIPKDNLASSLDIWLTSYTKSLLFFADTSIFHASEFVVCSTSVKDSVNLIILTATNIKNAPKTHYT